MASSNHQNLPTKWDTHLQSVESLSNDHRNHHQDFKHLLKYTNHLHGIVKQLGSLTDDYSPRIMTDTERTDIRQEHARLMQLVRQFESEWGDDLKKKEGDSGNQNTDEGEEGDSGNQNTDEGEEGDDDGNRKTDEAEEGDDDGNRKTDEAEEEPSNIHDDNDGSPKDPEYSRVPLARPPARKEERMREKKSFERGEHSDTQTTSSDDRTNTSGVINETRSRVTTPTTTRSPTTLNKDIDIILFPPNDHLPTDMRIQYPDDPPASRTTHTTRQRQQEGGAYVPRARVPFRTHQHCRARRMRHGAMTTAVMCGGGGARSSGCQIHPVHMSRNRDYV